MTLATDIEALEQRRCAALVAKDWAVLETLVHRDLVHIHATGMIETRDQYLTTARDVLEFLDCSRGPLSIATCGDAVVVHGLLEQRVRVQKTGAEHAMKAMVTQIWIRDGDAWRQKHFHACLRADL